LAARLLVIVNVTSPGEIGPPFTVSVRTLPEESAKPDIVGIDIDDVDEEPTVVTNPGAKIALSYVHVI
jgi:hypothetical protein